MRPLGLIAALGLTHALAHSACSSRTKTNVVTVATGGGGGADAGSGGGGADAGSGGGGAASGEDGGQAGHDSGGSGGAAVTYESRVLADGPSLYWREIAGTGSIVDASPSGNDGNYAGCVEPGALQSGATIHLCGGYLFAGDIFDFLDRSPFTFEAWIKPGALQDSEFARIVGKENPEPGPRQGWDLLVIGGQDGGTPELAFERWIVADGSQMESGVRLNDAALSSSELTHVVVTYDGTIPRIYLNGIIVAEGGPSTSSIPDTNGTFRIGADPFGGSNWLGDIDEIAVYEKALSAGQVAAHYDQGKAEGY